MKNSLLILALLAFGFLSCMPDRNAEKMSHLTIYGNSLSGNYDIVEYGVDKASASLRITVRPREFNEAPQSSAEIDALQMSVLYGELYKTASAAEAFAFERITERNRPVVEQFERYRGQLANADAYYAAFVSVFARGVPTIQADGTLFGQPAGTDLSEWFRFGDRNVIGLVGGDYTMFERADILKDYQAPADYFTKDRMLPLQLYLSTVGVPEEIDLKDLSVIRYVGDDIINVTVTIPVRFERYWDWCKSLYSDSGAEEEFRDGTLRMTLPFVRKP